MSRGRPLKAVVAAASLVVAPVATSAALPAASPGPAGLPTVAEVKLTSSVPAWVSAPSAASPRLIGRPAASSVMDISVQLPMRSQRLAEEAVARGEVLPEAEYDRRFGVPQAQVDAVTRWLRVQGLEVTSADRVAGAVGARGSVATLQRALHTTLATAVQHGRSGLVPVTAPVLPASLGVSAVLGLDTTTLAMPANVRRPAVPASGQDSGAPAAVRRSAGDTRCAHFWGEHVNTAVKPYANESNYLCGGYRPLQLAAMYGVTGARRLAPTVAILGAYDAKAMQAATNTYMARYHYPRLASYTSYPAANPRYQSQCGGTSVWAGEQALDVQATHAIAPSARILYYGARSCAFSDMLAAFQRVVRDRTATTVSLSFGSPSEAQLPAALHAAWTKATLQASLAGISVFASSGDDGDNTRVTGGRRAVDVPAAYAYVTAVGGTSEGATAAGKVVARTGWEDRIYRKAAKGWTSLGFLWGAGGGASSRVPQPSWQAGKVPAGKRAVPDVAALADPLTGFTTYYAGRYSVVGGTSLAAPVVASVVALSKARTGRKVGLASPSLYRLLGTSALRDVRPGSVGLYYPFDPTGAGRQPGTYVVGFDRRPQGDLQSRPGWDNVTGVGTPNGATFLDAFGG
jgi:subtilase family serine protease